MPKKWVASHFLPKYNFFRAPEITRAVFICFIFHLKAQKIGHSWKKLLSAVSIRATSSSVIGTHICRDVLCEALYNYTSSLLLASSTAVVAIHLRRHSLLSCQQGCHFRRKILSGLKWQKLFRWIPCNWKKKCSHSVHNILQSHASNSVLLGM